MSESRLLLASEPDSRPGNKPLPFDLVIPEPQPKGISPTEKLHDLVIVGAGPAGLTAGIYATRSRLETIILEGRSIGGQAATTDRIENYPGFPDGISGGQLVAQMEQQARKFGTIIIPEQATGCSLNPGGTFKVTTLEGPTYNARAVIAAMGAEYRRLGIPGETEYIGRGVSFCATCDGPFFKDRRIAVIGGGESAVSEALYLSRFTEEIHLVHRRDHLRATKILKERILTTPRLQFHWNSVAVEIRGKDLVESLVIRNILTDQLEELPVAGVFVFVGHVPQTGILQGLVRLNEQGYVITDSALQTSVPGIFAAGDVREKLLRQVSTAVSDGATAAFAVEKYLESK